MVGLMVGFLTLAAPAWADEIERWTDAAGNVHYRNTPGPRTGDESDGAAAPAAHGDTAAGTDSDADTYSTSASLRRTALERDLRATEKRIRDIDAKLASLARVRGQYAKGSAATGGVGTRAVDVRSEEEKALETEREQLAQHAAEVRNDAARLRQEVTAHLGETPAWWIDIR
jgi:uncharacterized protein DUF4124